MSIKVNSLAENFRPQPSDIVKVTQAGNITDILFNTHKSNGSPVRKLSKDLYEDIRTGEIKEFNHNSKRVDDLISVSRSLKELRNLINANILFAQNALFLTLTYKKNERDTKKVYNDFQNFRKRLSKLYNYEKWIGVLEPQARGAWHLHIILIFSDKAPFIDNTIIEYCWKQGFTKTRAIENVDNVGAYLSAYLSNITVDEAEEAGINTKYAELETVEIPDENGNKIPKKIIKGGRLHWYPAGTRIYRCSRNCAKPEVYYTSNEQAEYNTVFDTLTYESTKSIEDTETNFRNIINRRVYNAIL